MERISYNSKRVGNQKNFILLKYEFSKMAKAVNPYDDAPLLKEWQISMKKNQNNKFFFIRFKVKIIDR